MFRIICAKLLARRLVKLTEKSNDEQVIRVVCHHQPSMQWTDVYTPYKGKTKKFIQSILKETDKLGLSAALYFGSLENYEEAVGREFLIKLG